MDTRSGLILWNFTHPLDAETVDRSDAGSGWGAVRSADYWSPVVSLHRVKARQQRGPQRGAGRDRTRMVGSRGGGTGGGGGGGDNGDGSGGGGGSGGGEDRSDGQWESVVLDPSSSSSACEGGGCRVAVTVISRCESRPLLHRVATIVDEGKRRAERVRSGAEQRDRDGL